MVEIVKPHTYTWPTDGYPFAGLRFRVDELASRLGLAVSEWDVDGLGPARGFGFRSPSGRVYLLQELQIAVKFHGACGPEVHVDVGELATFGTKVLVDDVAMALGLSLDEVLSFADNAAEKRAAELVAQVAAARAAIPKSAGNSCL